MNKTIYVEGEGCNRTCGLSAPFYLCIKKAEEDYSVARLKALQNYRERLLVYGCLPDIAPDRLASLATIYTLAPRELDKIDEFFDGIQVKYADIKNPNAIKATYKGSFI